MSEPHVLTHRDAAVGVMTFNRPESMNTLDLPMVLAMEQALDDLEQDAQVRVIVVTGCDARTFMAGGNIADLNSRHALAHYQDFARVLHRVFRRFEVCDKPIIAAVNGWALGGGAEFMLTTDIRLMADNAKLGLPEIKLGLFPGRGWVAAFDAANSPVPGQDVDVHWRLPVGQRGSADRPSQPCGAARTIVARGHGFGASHRRQVALGPALAQNLDAARRRHALERCPVARDGHHQLVVANRRRP